MKQYKLLDENGNTYLSETKGEYGGNSRLKIYGTMDCPSANSAIARYGDSYPNARVFFADERTALANGYRPCGNCLKDKYKEYMEDPDKYRAKFGL